jgi:hypothetical protein
MRQPASNVPPWTVSVASAVSLATEHEGRELRPKQVFDDAVSGPAIRGAAQAVMQWYTGRRFCQCVCGRPCLIQGPEIFLTDRSGNVVSAGYEGHWPVDLLRTSIFDLDLDLASQIVHIMDGQSGCWGNVPGVTDLETDQDRADALLALAQRFITKRYELWDLRDEREALMAEIDLLAYLAGPLAEAKALRLSFEPSDMLREARLDALLWILNGKHGKSGMPDSAEPMPLKQQRRLALLEQITQKTVQLLQKPLVWAAVVALGRALQAREHLKYREVLRIIEDVTDEGERDQYWMYKLKGIAPGHPADPQGDAHDDSSRCPVPTVPPPGLLQ